MKFYELQVKMKEFNQKHGIERKVCTKLNSDGQLIRMIGRVVIKQEVFLKQLDKEDRTYDFDNYNKALTSHDLGYSIFATCPVDFDCMRIEDLTNEDIESAEIMEVTE